MNSLGLIVTTFVGILISSSASAQDARPAKPPLKLIDVFQLEYATDPQIDPEGGRIVYVRNFMDIQKDRRRSNLWVLNSDGSDARPLTTGTRNDSSPRWSPDGTRVLYVSSESGHSEIYCRWIESGNTARLTQLANEPSSLEWSADGKRIAFTMFVPSTKKPFAELPAKPDGAEWAELPRVIESTLYRGDGKGYLKDGFHHLFVLPAEGGTPTQLTSGDFHHNGPLSWSPDGTTILLSANRDPDWQNQPQQSEIYAVKTEDRSIRPITRRNGPDTHPVYSPDSQWIAWVGYDDKKLSHQTDRLSVIRNDGTGQKLLAGKLDRDIANPVWSGDSKSLTFQYDDHGTTRIGRVTLDDEFTVLAADLGGATVGRPYSSGTFSCSRNGKVAYTLSRPEHPGEVAVVDVGAKAEKRLTRLNEDLFSQRELGIVKEKTTPSKFDGKEIQYWIVHPPGFKAGQKYPMLLEIHGGPFANYGNRFSAEMQLYAAAGYLVVYANPRGSTGYGEPFANLIHHNYPGNDFDDLMSVVDDVVAQGSADPENLFVTGGSGGGILTAWIVGHTDRFRAAVSAKPVINWHSFVLTTDMYPFFTQYWFPGSPWEHAEHYRKRSPLTYVDQVKTPTMLITGEQDYRTPISESEQFFQALKLRKVDTALIRVPDASHDIVARPSRLMMQVAYTLKWFERHRKN